MVNNTDDGGSSLKSLTTTTISTIAVQSGSTRIVVALLQVWQVTAPIQTLKKKFNQLFNKKEICGHFTSF